MHHTHDITVTVHILDSTVCYDKNYVCIGDGVVTVHRRQLVPGWLLCSCVQAGQHRCSILVSLSEG